MYDLEDQGIWELCRTSIFEIDMQLYRDVTCTICKNILQNSYQGPCGCKYCFGCVTDYLKDEDKFCPGEFETCKIRMMSIAHNIRADHEANRKILLMKVKCPEEHCQFTDELQNMKKHLLCHQLKCPYHDLGCNSLGIGNDMMESHMIKEAQTHVMLMTNCIQNLRNEIGCMKENAQKNEIEIERLKESNANLRTDMTITSQESLATITNEMLTICDRINTLERRIKTITDEKIILEKNLEEVQMSVGELKSIGSKSLEKEEAQLHETLLSESCSSSTTSNFNNRALKKGVSASSDPYESLSKSVSHVRQNETAFEWRIDNFQQKRTDAQNGTNKLIFSEPFYSHSFGGYKLQLRIYPNGIGVATNKWISLYFAFVKGNYDDIVSWPMKREITIALIDQVSGEIHTRRSYSYDTVRDKVKHAFHKPPDKSDEKSYYLGMKQFMNFQLLIDNDRLYREDAIVVKCLID